jgi:Bacterial regulatory proteins, tetR family
MDSAMKLIDGGADTPRAKAKRLAGPNRRAQLLRTAPAQFAMTGLHGTTSLALAQAAGISEAILYVRFRRQNPDVQKRSSKSTSRRAFAYLTVISLRLPRRV